MEYIINGAKEAIGLIISGNSDLFTIVVVSLKVSLISVILATILGVPFGFFIGIRFFRGRRIVITLLNTLLAMPTVLIGLLVYSFICRSGPLGDFSLLYTPWAMIIGQTILAFPIIAALSLSAISLIDKRVALTAYALGADKFQAALLVLKEARFAVMSAIVVGFGRIFAEIGISMMLGGNIKGLTRNITTAIAFETAKGEFALGIALGIILLIVALVINILFSILQNHKHILKNE